jgi:hypothetical protein
MGLMLFPEEEQGDGGEQQQGRPETPGVAGRWGMVGVMGHGRTLQKTGVANLQARLGASAARRRVSAREWGYSL